MIAILHSIRSLHNVGSIFRTADAAGIERLYLCGITPSPLDRFGNVRPQLAKVALGAEKNVQWEKAKSTSKVIEKLKKDGYHLVAVEQSKKAVPYYKFRIIRTTSHVRIGLILGNELHGLPQSILKKADTIVEIPMRGKKESLNVSVAFGIIAFHITYS